MGAKKQERLMTLAELSAYLHMGKNTVLRLVNDDKVPGVSVDGEWRFERKEIDGWLAEQNDGDVEDFEEILDGLEVPLGDLMPPEAVLHDLRARDAMGVIEELAARAYSVKWLNDKPWFVGALLEREALASTAMEGGVAFLHTRARDTKRIKRPFVICGRSYSGVDFGAPDGKPTFLFFLLGLKYDKLHLPILGRLARLTMRNPTIVGRLRATMSPIKMRDLLLKLDSDELASVQGAASVIRPLSRPQMDSKDRLREIMRLSARKKYDERKADEAEKKDKRRKKAAAARKAATAAAYGYAPPKPTPATTKKKAAKATTAAKKTTAKKTPAAKTKSSTTKKAVVSKKPTTAAKKKAATTTKSKKKAPTKKK